MSDGWDPSIVDFAAPADGFLTRSFGGRSGPLALENGASITFPWQTQQEIPSTYPGTVVSYDDTGLGFIALSLEGPTMLAGANRAFVDLRGFNDGVPQLVMGDGVTNNYISISDAQTVIQTSGAALILNAGVTLTSPTSTVNISAETAIQITNDTTNGTTITIDSNGALNLVGVPVNINGVDVSTPLGAWPTWTPTLTQSATVTKTTNNAAYQKNGRTVTGHTHLTVIAGTAGTAGNAITVGLPVASASFSGTPVIGTFWCYSSAGVVAYQGALVQVSTTTAVGWAHGLSGNIGAAPNFGLVNTDQVGYSFIYQAAS